jgi:hypothetical protein
MREPITRPDAIEQASQLFWNPPTLDELLADVRPLDQSEHFDIVDLSDEEWEAFEQALAE